MGAVKRGGGTWAGGFRGDDAGDNISRRPTKYGPTIGKICRNSVSESGAMGTRVELEEVATTLTGWRGAWTGVEGTSSGIVGAWTAEGALTGGEGAWTGGEGAATTMGEDWTREERSSAVGDFKGERIRNPRRKPELEEAATALTG